MRAEVTFHHAQGNRYTGLVQTYNAFGSGSPLTLHLVVEVEPQNATTTVLRVQASPREPGVREVWAPLRQALDSLTFE